MRLPSYLHAAVPAWALPLLLLLAVGACEPAADPEPTTFVPAVAFDTIAVEVQAGSDTFRLSAELAETDAQRSYGLKQRPALPEDHGMLFVYTQPQDSSAGMWMYRTLIPLDIAYLDAEGRIVAIRSMVPCESPYPRVCRTYPAGVPYSAALEVNSGYFDRRGIGLGDRVVRVDSAGTSGGPSEDTSRGTSGGPSEDTSGGTSEETSPRTSAGTSAATSPRTSAGTSPRTSAGTRAGT